MKPTNPMNAPSANRAFALAIAVGAVFMVPGARAAITLPNPIPPEAFTVVRAQYVNQLANTDQAGVNPSSNDATSFAVFGGGSFGAYAPAEGAAEAAVPHGSDGASSSTLLLQASSFGETFSSEIPYDTFSADFLAAARGLLFGDGSPDYPSSEAAFRFKDLLYGKLEDFDSNADPAIKSQIVNRLEVRLTTNDDWTTLLNSMFDQAAKNRAALAESVIRFALRYSPLDQNLADTLLDIYYYRAQFQTMIAKEKLAKAAELPLDPIPADWVINKEITAYKSAVDDYKAAVEVYFGLFKEPLYVNAAAYSSNGEPFGLFLFKTFQPRRSLLSASYDSGGGTILPVEPKPGEPNVPAVLMGGFKDMALMLDAMSDQARMSVELARRYAMRGNVVNDVAVDLQAGAQLLTIDRQKLEFRADFLLSNASQIPGFDPANLSGSGVPEAIQGFQTSLAQMGSTLQFINGKTNLLGYADDFLFLIGDLPGTAGAGFNDSFDRIAGYLDETADNNPLGTAVVRFNEAYAGRDAYKGSLEQLQQQFLKTQTEYRERLYKIVGEDEPTDADRLLDPTHPRYQLAVDTCGNPLPTGAASPIFPAGELNDGSDMWLQANKIQQAFLELKEFTVQEGNLDAEIEEQLKRIELQFQISNAKQSIYIRYGNAQASLESALGLVEAGQALAQNLADSINAAGEEIPNVAGSFGYAVNGLLQGIAEVGKGAIRAQKERNAAMQDAELVAQDFLLDQFDGYAELNRLIRSKFLLAVQTQGAVLNLAQQISQLQSLRDEANEILRRMAEWNLSYATRYHADPVHRLRYTEAVIHADLTFREAQRWVYYAARALEYKLNTPFIYTYGGTSYSSSQSVFRARNAIELRNFMQAMKELNANFQTNPQNDRYDWISLRKDILGMGDDLSKFHDYLNAHTNQAGEIVLTFDTVLSKGQFFRGPSSALDPGLWNDKIRYLKFNIPGPHTGSNNSVVAVMYYGDYSFIRNQSVGAADPNRADRLVGELREWNAGLWYFDVFLSQFRFAPRQKFTPQVALSAAAQTEPSDTFKYTDLAERSVAATNWLLLLDTNDPNFPLKVSEMDDFEIYFAHRAFDRQVP